MKSENILMDEIVKIRRELKRIKKLKKKAKREKKLKKKHRVSTKYLTNPEQPKPQPIMITMPPQQIQQPLENLRDIGRNYLIPGNNLINPQANPGNQLVVRPRPAAIPPPVIPPVIPPAPIGRRLPPLPPSSKKKKKRMTQAMQYEKPQLQKKTLPELRELIKLRLPGQYTDAELKQIKGKNKNQAIDYFLQKIREQEQQHEQNINEQFAVVTDDNFGLDNSQLQNSIFDDNNYDAPNDNNSFMDASLANAFEDLKNLPPLTFNTPKQVEKKVEKKAAKYDADDDDFFESVVQKLSNEDDDYYLNFEDINKDFVDTFYNPMSDQFARATPAKATKTPKKASSIPVSIPDEDEDENQGGGGGAVRVIDPVAKRGRGRPKKS